MYNELQRAIRLIRKTGDRIILFDSENKQNGYVLLSLEEYERLMLDRHDVRGLTEDELLDKINRDIAIWKSEQEANISQQKPVSFSSAKKEESESNKNSKISSDLDSREQKEQSEPERSEQVGERKRWQIPEQRKQAAEEIIEEDRQYLEYIPF